MDLMLTEPSQVIDAGSGESEQQRLALLRKPRAEPRLLRSLLGAARRYSWFRDSYVNARMCSPGRALIRFAQRSTNHGDRSGHHTSGVWYTQPHYLSQRMASIVDTWAEMHGVEGLQCIPL